MKCAGCTDIAASSSSSCAAASARSPDDEAATPQLAHASFADLSPRECRLLSVPPRLCPSGGLSGQLGRLLFALRILVNLVLCVLRSPGSLRDLLLSPLLTSTLAHLLLSTLRCANVARRPISFRLRFCLLETVDEPSLVLLNCLLLHGHHVARGSDCTSANYAPVA